MIVKSKIKYIQSLSHKKQRDEDGVFIAEGPKIINELLSDPSTQLVELFATAAWHQQERVSGLDYTEIMPFELEKISFLSTPNQVLGIFKKPVYSALRLAGTVTIMADNIQDPGNLGTIIRCADWFGISQVVCSAGCADIFSPKAVQSTMGSVARVNVVYDELEEVLAAHPSISVYAATLDGRDVYDVEPLSEAIILIGNESKGISKNLIEKAHHRVTIPRSGRAESLNAAVATGILLSHLTKHSSPLHSRS